MAAGEGIFAEPAAAVPWAAVKRDRQAGRLTGAETAVCLVTGIGFKDSAALGRMTEGVALPMIEADEITRIEA